MDAEHATRRHEYIFSGHVVGYDVCIPHFPASKCEYEMSSATLNNYVYFARGHWFYYAAKMYCFIDISNSTKPILRITKQ